jgi:hypothetical protein
MMKAEGVPKDPGAWDRHWSRAGALLWWGRHSCLPVARECGGIPASAERATIMKHLRTAWAGSGGKNAAARGPRTDKNVCPTESRRSEVWAHLMRNAEW